VERQYVGLDLQLTHQPADHSVLAAASPRFATERVGGGTCQPARRDVVDDDRVVRCVRSCLGFKAPDRRHTVDGSVERRNGVNA
jgi:hypothetical protein